MHYALARKLTTRPMKIAFAAVLAAVMMIASSAYAFFSSDRNSPVGNWKTIDDETGEAKSIVRIYQVDDKMYGRVDQLLLKPGALCEACEGEDHMKPITGMVILWGLEDYGDGVWGGGKIFDPQKAKTYRAKIWLENEGAQLKVRGYAGPFFRTQTWHRQ